MGMCHVPRCGLEVCEAYEAGATSDGNILPRKLFLSLWAQMRLLDSGFFEPLLSSRGFDRSVSSPLPSTPSTLTSYTLVPQRFKRQRHNVRNLKRAA